MTGLLIVVLIAQVVMLVMVLYGTNIRDRAWQLPLIGKLLDRRAGVLERRRKQ